MADTVDKTSTSGSTGGNSAPGSDLVTQQGRTSIADGVVAKIAGIATRDVSGVHNLGGGTARALGSIRERIPGNTTNHAQGITVEVGERQAAIDVELVAEFGVAIVDLAAAVRKNVISSVERMTGLQVTEVNVTVQDVYVPSDDEGDDDDSEPRVQ